MPSAAFYIQVSELMHNIIPEEQNFYDHIFYLGHDFGPASSHVPWVRIYKCSAGTNLPAQSAKLIDNLLRY
jgi:hypothetical protein